MLDKEEDLVALANDWARMSCSKWNRCVWEPRTILGKLYKIGVLDKLYRASRRYFRRKYQRLAETENDRLSVDKNYSWLYGHPDFADWEEDDNSETYSLISDPSGCVVKYATSYCAYQIFKTTGEWPQRKTRRRMDAKDWQTFLREAGYTEIVESLDVGHSYVGIKPDEGEWGLVVWFEGKTKDGKIMVSTYRDKKPSHEKVKKSEYLWVKIT